MEYSNNVCYIFGAFDDGNISINSKEGDMIICADGGYKNLEKNGIIPHVVMGDFDSLGYVPKGNNVIVFPSEKDDSDTFIAAKYGFEKGYKNFVIYGGIGGRLDHTIANIQLLQYISDRGGNGCLIGEHTFITAVKDSSLIFESCRNYITPIFEKSPRAEITKVSHEERENPFGQIFVSKTKYISVFSLSEKCEGVTLNGLKYSVENITINNSFPIGLSNEFLLNDSVPFIRVQSGTLLVIMTNG